MVLVENEYFPTSHLGNRLSDNYLVRAGYTYSYMWALD